MRQFPAIIKFSTQRQVINSSDYLSLTSEFLDNSDFGDEKSLLCQLAGVHMPVNQKYATLSKFDYNLDIPYPLRFKLRAEDIQKNLDVLTNTFEINKIFRSTFDNNRNRLIRVEKITVTVDKDEQRNFIYTLKLISIPYTALDKKTLSGGWDEYLLIDGDQTKNIKKGSDTKPFAYILQKGIEIEYYRKL